MASTLLRHTSFLQLPNSNKLDSAQLGRYDLVPTRRPRRNFSVNCKVKHPVTASPPPGPASLTLELHKYFDQAVITVRPGDVVRGTVLSISGGGKADDKEKDKDKAGNVRKKGACKRDFDCSVILPMAGKGGDLILYADEGKGTLLEFRGRRGRYCAKRCGNVDAVRVLNPQLRD